MERENIALLLLVILLILTFGTMFKMTSYINNMQDEACQDIGFERYEFNAGQSYCEDINGNLYYVKKECILAGFSCTVHEITVGNIRTKYEVLKRDSEQ